MRRSPLSCLLPVLTVAALGGALAGCDRNGASARAVDGVGSAASTATTTPDSGDTAPGSANASTGTGGTPGTSGGSGGTSGGSGGTSGGTTSPTTTPTSTPTPTPTPTPVVAKCTGTESTPSRLFLQQVGTDHAIVKWRGNALGVGDPTVVCFGTDPAALPLTSKTAATVTATHHSEALLKGLKPDTLYYYSVGGAGTAPTTQSFRTAPLAGNLPADGNVRMWILGDPGTAADVATDTSLGDKQKAVRDGYLKWSAANGAEPLDLMVLLGDSAYLDGTDMQFQAAVFGLYTDLVKRVGLWTTIGNHEMGAAGTSTQTSTSMYLPGDGGPGDLPPDSMMPYLNIFTLPTKGENGGEPSGTEQYYSFDYGNVHMVSLDSQVTMRDAGNNAAMKKWLINDLSANKSDWTIVIFHHPPYTKGSHDSDAAAAGGADGPILTVRQEYTKIFEDYHVDMVYSGHSHSYERSFYLKGHTGLAATFDPLTMSEHNAAGVPLAGTGSQSYKQISALSGLDDKVVYTVAGSAGQASGTSTGFPHNAMSFSKIVMGSVVLDANRKRLDARFIDVNGQVLDEVVMTR